MEQAAGMGRDEKYELALHSSFTLKMLIHGKAGWSTACTGHLFPLVLVPRIQDRDRTSVGNTPLESALFAKLHNKPGN